MLGGFACFSAAVSFLGGQALASLQLAPVAARGGVLLLTFAFVALAWERDGIYRRLARDLGAREVQISECEGRLAALEALLEAGERFGTSLAVDDVMRLVVDAAVDLTGAVRGEVYPAPRRAEGPHLVQRLVDAPEPDTPLHRLSVGLVVDGEAVGLLSLDLPEERPLDAASLDVLARFCRHAAAALRKAILLAMERDAVTYLRALNDAQSQLLSAVSHELRTPLTSVLGYARTLEHHWDALDDERKRRFVGSICTQGSRLARSVEGLLEAARLEMEAHSRPRWTRAGKDVSAQV